MIRSSEEAAFKNSLGPGFSLCCPQHCDSIPVAVSNFCAIAGSSRSSNSKYVMDGCFRTNLRISSVCQSWKDLKSSFDAFLLGKPVALHFVHFFLSRAFR